MLGSHFDPLIDSWDVQVELELGGCLTGLGGVGQCVSASKASLGHFLRVPVGPECLPQMFNLLSLCAAITHLDVKTQYDTPHLSQEAWSVRTYSYVRTAAQPSDQYSYGMSCVASIFSPMTGCIASAA